MSFLGLFRKPAQQAVIREAETPRSADIAANDHLWRTLGQQRRDLAPISHDKMRELALFMRRENGMAKRFEEILVDFTAGSEPAPQTEDPDLQEILDVFWDDPINCLRVFGRELSGQLRTIGEQCVTLHHKSTDGHLRLGYLSPELIDRVMTMPGNVRHRAEVWTKQGATGERLVYRIILPGETVEDVYGTMLNRARQNLPISRTPGLRAKGVEMSLPDKQEYDGTCMYFAVNVLSDATRGISDLFPDADLMRAFKTVVFNAAERAELLNRLGFDVMVKGQNDPKELQKIATVVKAAFSKTGGAFAHNDAVEVTPWAADLKSSDMEVLTKVVKLAILGNWGFPLHWFADGGEANLATAGEMGGPTIRKLKSAQTTVRMMLRSLLDWQVQLKRALTNELSGIDEDVEFDVLLPDIASKDTARQSAELGQVTSALSLAVMEQFVTHKSAGLLWQRRVSEIYGEEFREEDAALLDQVEEDEKEKRENPQEPPQFPPLEPRPGMDDDEEGEGA
jgi:hypothetical protein